MSDDWKEQKKRQKAIFTAQQNLPYEVKVRRAELRNSLLTNALIVVLIMDLAKYIKSEVKNEKIESLKWLIFALITGNALLFVYVNEILKNIR